MKTVTGRVSGDCECFCWEVTEEEYRRIKGERDYQLELSVRRNDDGSPDPFYEGEPWRIYPGDLMEGGGVKTYTITESDA